MRKLRVGELKWISQSHEDKLFSLYPSPPNTPLNLKGEKAAKRNKQKDILWRYKKSESLASMRKPRSCTIWTQNPKLDVSGILGSSGFPQGKETLLPHPSRQLQSYCSERVTYEVTRVKDMLPSLFFFQLYLCHRLCGCVPQCPWRGYTRWPRSLPSPTHQGLLLGIQGPCWSLPGVRFSLVQMLAKWNPRLLLRCSVTRSVWLLQASVMVTRSHAITKSSSLTSGEWNSNSLVTVLCMAITFTGGASETTCHTQANSKAHHTGVWMINNNACLVDEGAEGGITWQHKMTAFDQSVKTVHESWSGVLRCDQHAYEEEHAHLRLVGMTKQNTPHWAGEWNSCLSGMYTLSQGDEDAGQHVGLWDKQGMRSGAEWTSRNPRSRLWSDKRVRWLWSPREQETGLFE